MLINHTHRLVTWPIISLTPLTTTLQNIFFFNQCANNNIHKSDFTMYRGTIDLQDYIWLDKQCIPIKNKRISGFFNIGPSWFSLYFISISTISTQMNKWTGRVTRLLRMTSAFITKRFGLDYSFGLFKRSGNLEGDFLYKPFFKKRMGRLQLSSTAVPVNAEFHHVKLL